MKPIYVIDDSEFLTLVYTEAMVRKFDKNQPRHPEGSSEGGQFAETGTTGQVRSDPMLAAQAKEGIAAVEKLIPDALAKVDLTEVPQAWDHLSESVRDKVKDYYIEKTYDYTSTHLDTFDLDTDVGLEIRKQQRTALIEKAKFLVAKDYQKQLQLDPASILIDEEETDKKGRLLIQLKALRRVDGSELNLEDQWEVLGAWHERFDQVHSKAIEIYKDTDEYLARREKLVLERIGQNWKTVENFRKLELVEELRKKGELPDDALESVHREPDKWVTGVEEGTAESDQNYAITHTLALKLTELRMDQLRAERGLLGPRKKPTYTIMDRSSDDIGDFVVVSGGQEISFAYTHEEAQAQAEDWATAEMKEPLKSSHAIIHDVWQQWKGSSSVGLSLSLQLAAAEELGGHHRLTADEVDEAQKSARNYGGMETLRAFARAQWDVTQTVMAKAGEDKVDVYRALMLDKEDVDKTPHQLAGKLGDPIPPPTNIKILVDTSFGGQPVKNPHPWPVRETVEFDFNGEHLTVMKERQRTPATWYELDEATKTQVRDQWKKNVIEVAAVNPTDPAYSVEAGMKTFEKFSDTSKMNLLQDWRVGGQLPPAPFESTEAAVARRVEAYAETSNQRNFIFTKLPAIVLQRAGAQSTTGKREVANDWGGVGNSPRNPVRVVLRMEAPSTSVLSLPVYGMNVTEEHESVLLGTKDKWLWDAWLREAPDFESQPVSTTTKKAEKVPLIIDLQAADRGKPHWLSGATVTAPRPVQSVASVFKYNKAQLRHPKGSSTGGQFARGTSVGNVDDPAQALRYPPFIPIPPEQALGSHPRLVGAEPPPPVGFDPSKSPLMTMAITDADQLGGGANESHLVTLDDGSKAVYKPESGEQWGEGGGGGGFANGDITDYIDNHAFSLAEREAMAYEVDQALGLDLVPETVLRTTVDDVGSIGSGGGGRHSEDSLQGMYDSYRQDAEDRAQDEVGQRMNSMFAEAQGEHVEQIKERADEIGEIWNELVADFPDQPEEYGSPTMLAQHPVLPLGSQEFERKEPHRVVDLLEVLDEAKVRGVSDRLSGSEKDRVKEVLLQKLKEGYNELGDVDESRAKSHLTYGTFIDQHADTENRMLNEYIQSFDAWKRSQGYANSDPWNMSSGDGGGRGRNTQAPHPSGGSLQRFLPNASDWGTVGDDHGSKLAVLDYVIGSMDRHSGNVMFDETDSPKAIDNGYSFPAVNGDEFTFRSVAGLTWRRDSGTIIESTRREISEALKNTDWEALVDRHPSMNQDERSSFLVRVERMKKALETPEGLRRLWKGLNVMSW